MMREQRAAMEKELGSMQAKAQGSYQELQTMQIKVMHCFLEYICTPHMFALTKLQFVLKQKHPI